MSSLPTFSELGIPTILEQARNIDGQGYNMSLVYELIAHRSASRAKIICQGVSELSPSEGTEIVKSIENTAVEELSDPELLLDVPDLEISIEIVRQVFQEVFNSDTKVALDIKTAYGIDNSLAENEQLASASKLHLLRVLAHVKNDLPVIETNSRLRRRIGRHLDRSIILVYLERVSK